MTIAAPHAAAALDMPSAVAALRAGGLRVSRARRVVLAALLAADGPATAEQLASGCGGLTPASDLASTYRNLDTFAQIGLVRHLQPGTGAGRYVLSARCDGGYATCARCEAFEPLPPGTRELLRRELLTGAFGASLTPLTIVGVCARCDGR